MVGSTPAASRTLPTCHTFAVLLLLLEMTAEAFTVTGGPTRNRHQHRELKHECSAAEMGRDHRRRSLLPLVPLEAAPQQMQQDGDVWWEGDVDPWTEAANRALMQQFKDSVLDEDGLSVRAMSDESARELADQTADGILDLVEREFRSRLPPPSSRADLFASDDPAADATATTAAGSGMEVPVGEGSTLRLMPPAASPRGPGLAERKTGGEEDVCQAGQDEGGEEEEEEEEGGEDEDGGLDWGDGADSKGKRRVAIGGDGGGGKGGVDMVAHGGVCEPRGLESLQDDAEYESTLMALKAYYSQHGNLLLTRKYLMPVAGGVTRNGAREEGGGDPRLVEHRGWRLGQKAYNMKFWKKHIRGRPSRRQELAALGFVWGRLQDEYNLFVEALLAYKDIEGSLLVPTSFVVPDTAPWPLCCQGLRLGAKVSGVRNQSLYVRADVARWYQLDAMGFVWDLSDAPFRQVYDALLQYKALHGNLHVPVAFCVPSTAPWQEDLWGLALGQRVLDIRARHRYIRNDPERIKLLNEAGFRWADAAKASYGNVVRALKAYRKIKGRDFSVPSAFVVPSFLPWPQSCWGLRLGTALVDIRSKGRYLKGVERRQRRLELERLGVFAQSREAILANVVKGLRCYLSIFGDTMVPQGFVVPDGEAWPQECRGQKLGSMLYGLRRRPERLDRHPGVRAELTALGFSWQVPKKGPRGPRKRKPHDTTTAAAAAAPGTGGAGAGVKPSGLHRGSFSSGSGDDGVGVVGDYPAVGGVETDAGSRVRRPRRVIARDGGACVSAAGAAAAPVVAAATGAGGVCSYRVPARPKDTSRSSPSRSCSSSSSSSSSISRSRGGGDGVGSSSSSSRSSSERRRSRDSSLSRGRNKKAGRLLSPAARWLLEEGGAMLGGSGGQAGGAAGAGALPGAPR